VPGVHFPNMSDETMKIRNSEDGATFNRGKTTPDSTATKNAGNPKSFKIKTLVPPFWPRKVARKLRHPVYSTYDGMFPPADIRDLSRKSGRVLPDFTVSLEEK
jgi:hypothetical protein